MHAGSPGSLRTPCECTRKQHLVFPDNLHVHPRAVVVRVYPGLLSPLLLLGLSLVAAARCGSLCHRSHLHRARRHQTRPERVSPRVQILVPTRQL